MGRPGARSRFSTTASVATANRYPASCSRQHRSTSSSGDRASSKPWTASKTSLRTARLALRPKGRNPSCRVAAGTGTALGDPSRAPKSNTPATRSAFDSAANMEASQPGRTTSSASQKANSRPRADRTPMFRAAAAPGRADASTRWMRGSRSDHRSTQERVPSSEPLSATMTSQPPDTSWVERA